MRFYSTNKKTKDITLKDAVIQGLASDGGLYLPNEIPSLPDSFWDSLCVRSLQDLSVDVCKPYLQADLKEEEIIQITNEAINFEAPLVKLFDGLYILELFHGPTLAFKDFAARFMSRLMIHLLDGEQVTILAATSGDTGSAVAHGFYNVPGINVVLLYPKGQVSDIQEKQFTTLGNNITALEVEGTFDDCQHLVKQAFSDTNLREKFNISSANSINIARLIPQTFYYFYAFSQLLKEFNNTLPKTIFSVPSGNYGNLSAGLIAKKMGLNISHFVASANANNIVPKYLETGNFKPQPSISTISNAMDVGNPSNFARILDLYDNSLEDIQKDITGAYFTDKQTKECMKKVYDQTGYVLDPHTAVGYLGLEQYRSTFSEPTAGVVLSTAHPAKFIDVVEDAIGKKIDIPERLAVVIDKKKQTIPMTTDYDDFKKFLTTSIRL